MRSTQLRPRLPWRMERYPPSTIGIPSSSPIIAPVAPASRLNTFRSRRNSGISSELCVSVDGLFCPSKTVSLDCVSSPIEPSVVSKSSTLPIKPCATRLIASRTIINAAKERSLPAFGITVSVGRSTLAGRTCPAASVGIKPKIVVIRTPMIKPFSGGLSANRKVRFCATKISAIPCSANAMSQPSRIPMRLPTMPIRMASTINRMVTSSGSSPMVLSTATSVVRRLTMTSMVLTIPIPPMSIETSPIITTRSFTVFEI